MEGRLPVSADAYLPTISGTHRCFAAYDIKLLIGKGNVDIIRPQWITDCIARGELVPLKKK